MRSFILRLQDATRVQDFTDVTSFVGEDASGGFGILAGHARLMTVLVTGMARFRSGAHQWTYLAVPGAALYFHDNLLTVSTRHYLVDDDYMRISQALQQQLIEEEKLLRATRETLHHMEEEILRRLWAMGRRAAV